MAKTIAELSPVEFEKIIETTIDKRLSVWLTQVLDALESSEDEKKPVLKPEFIVSLKNSLEQAAKGKTVDLKSFRKELGL
ncbi:hypothetical protein JXI42_09730 [bacterium]|nr:hypothetical protein [bacterium]